MILVFALVSLFTHFFAGKAGKSKDEWQKMHRRYFKIAGITVLVESDLDFDTITFREEFAPFAVEGPGDDNVTIRHYFELPDTKGKDLGKELYRKAPWAISRKNDTWCYQEISSTPDDPQLHRMAVFNADHTRATIYSPPGTVEGIRTGGWYSLSLFPTDQIWLAPLLADRNAVLLHSAAAIVNGHGLLFVGHSKAGKSTTITLVKNAGEKSQSEDHQATGGSHTSEPLQVEILCDERNIVRRWNDKWYVHGTWSYGDVPDVSAVSAPLRAILFLQRDTINEITPFADRREAWKRLIAMLIRPMETATWWMKELDVLEQIVKEIPCYTMRFDKSGGIVQELQRLVQDTPGPKKRV
jgi:hypothetical protein